MSNFPPHPQAEPSRPVRVRSVRPAVPTRQSINRACAYGAIIAAILAALLIILFTVSPVSAGTTIHYVLVGLGLR